MTNRQWHAIVRGWVRAKRELLYAYIVLDGEDGLTQLGEMAQSDVLEHIDRLFLAEWAYYEPRGMTLPPGVELVQTPRGPSLPGFSLVP